jgi:WD40 repeat protein
VWTVGGPRGRVIRVGSGAELAAVADGPVVALAESDRLLVATEAGAGWWANGLRWLWTAPRPRGREVEVVGDRWVERGDATYVRGVPDLADRPVQAAALAPDGMLAVADGGLTLIPVEGPPVGVGLPGQALLLDWSPDGGTLAVATTEGDIALVDPADGTARTVRKGVGQPVHLAVGDGTRGLVVTGSERAWQFGTWASKSATEGVGPVALVGVGADHIVLPMDGTLRHSDLRGGRGRELEWTGAPLERITVGPDGRALLIGVDGSWTVWDARRRSTRPFGTEALSSIAVDPTGRFLVAGTTTGGVWTWSLERSAPASVLDTGAGRVHALDVDPIGRVLWADSRSMGLDSRRWFLDGVTAVALDGDRALGFGADKVVVASGSDLFTWPISALGSPVDVRGTGDRWTALAPDGRTLEVELNRRVATQASGGVPRATASGGVGPTWRGFADGARGTVDLWGPMERSLAVDDATGVAIDERNGRIWTVGEDGCIRGWDLGTGELRSAWWVGPEGTWAGWDGGTGWRSGGMSVTTW